MSGCSKCGAMLGSCFCDFKPDDSQKRLEENIKKKESQFNKECIRDIKEIRELINKLYLKAFPEYKGNLSTLEKYIDLYRLFVDNF